MKIKIEIEYDNYAKALYTPDEKFPLNKGHKRIKEG
jgi:hypothetical protein